MKLRCEAVKRPARNKNQWPRAKAVGRRAKGQRAGFATVACARFCESRLAFVARVGWGGAHSLKGWERTRGAVAAAAAAAAAVAGARERTSVFPQKAAAAAAARLPTRVEADDGANEGRGATNEKDGAARAHARRGRRCRGRCRDGGHHLHIRPTNLEPRASQGQDEQTPVRGPVPGHDQEGVRVRQDVRLLDALRARLRQPRVQPHDAALAQRRLQRDHAVCAQHVHLQLRRAHERGLVDAHHLQHQPRRVRARVRSLRGRAPPPRRCHRRLRALPLV